MTKLNYVKPAAGIDIRLWPTELGFHERKPEVAAEVLRMALSKGRPIVQDASMFTQMLPGMLMNDDTEPPKEALRIEKLGQEGFRLDMGNDFWIGAEDGSMRHAEGVILPLHTSTLIYAGLHYRSGAAYYCTALMTTELEALQSDEPPQNPLFVYIG